MSNDAGGGASPPPRSSLTGALPLSILGGFFLLLAAYLALANFWKMGERVSDAVVLTGLVAELPPGQQRTFGYGGDGQGQAADVPFQSPEMSNISFLIRRDDGGYSIKAVDDEVILRPGRFLPTRERIEPGEERAIFNGDRFEARGPLGRANFTVSIPEGSNELRLRLARPLFYEIRRGPGGQNRDQTRLVFATDPEPIASAHDELLIRSRFRDGRPARTYRISTLDDQLRLFEEGELGDAAAPAPAAPAPAAPAATPPAGQPPAPARGPIIIRPGVETEIGSVVVGYRHHIKPFLGTRVNVVRLFAFKLVAAILLAGLALLVGPHIRWPYGFPIYGCAAFFVSVSLVLSGRDALFPPHSERFAEYLSALYYCFIFLCLLRIPVSADGEESSRENYARLFGLYPIFLAIHLLISEPFSPATYGLWEIFRAAVKVFFQFVGLLVVTQLVNIVVRWALGRFRGAEWTPSLMWRWMTVPLLLILGVVLFTWATGGQEALTLAGRRIHLPTLLLPVVVVWASAVARAAEEAEEGMTTWWLLILCVCGLAAVGVYRFFSDDNGGASLLAAGLLFSVLLSTRKRVVPALLALVLLVGGFGVAWLSRSPRFGLAWGGQEVGVLYFDQAKNLRLARDMARAGGQGLDLLIPVEVRSNIHNDLVAAFVVGYFGRAVFAFVFIAFCVFYYHLFDGLRVRFAPQGDAEGGGRARDTLLAACGALVLTFALQSLWVMTASLQKIIPLTGLDLLPISVSTISVLGFVGVLFGSVALAHSHADAADGEEVGA